MSQDLIVIGGGVSGIAAAIRAAQLGRRVVLLEAADRLGGCVQTWRPVDGFWLELGAHTAYNSYGALLDLIPPPTQFEELIPRAKVGYHFFEAGQVRSPFSRLGIFEAAFSLPFGLARDKTGLDVQTYFSALLGRGNWQRLLDPAFAAVLSQPAARYPAAWLFRKKPRNKAAPRKFTHADGLQGWLASLVARWPVEVRLNTPATAMRVAEDGVVVDTAAGPLAAGAAMVATTPWVAGALLAEVLPGAVAEALQATELARIETLGVVVPKDKVRLPPVAGLIGGDDAFYSAVSRDYLAHADWRGFAFHFKPGRLDGAGRSSRAAEVLGCAPADLAHAIDIENVLPVLTTASVDLAQQTSEALLNTPVRLAGNYLNGLSMGDAAQHAVDATEQLFKSV